MTIAARIYATPRATDDDIADLLWVRAQDVAALSGRVPTWPPTSADRRETPDGLVQVDALFTVKDIDQ